MAEQQDRSPRRKGLIFGLLLLCAAALFLFLRSSLNDPTAKDSPDSAQTQANPPVVESETISEGGQSVASERPATEPDADSSEPEPDAAAVDEQAPTFDVVRIEPDGFSVIAGRAASPGSVTLELDGAALQGGTVEAGPDGRFVMMLEIPRSATVQALDLVHQPESAPNPIRSTERVFVDATPVADQVASLSPPVESLAAPQGSPQSDVDVEVADPAIQPRLIIADETGLRVLPSAREPSAVQVVALDTISYDNVGDVSLGGRGAGEGFVRIYLDNKPIITSRIQDDGYWSIQLPEVKSGVYTLRLDELDAQGEVSSRIETPFKREEPEALRNIIPESEVAEGPVNFRVKTVQPGATLWAIAEERYGNGVAYVKVFEANRDAIQNPDLIFPGQVFKTPD